MSNFTQMIITPDVEQSPWDIDPVATGRISHIGLLRHGTAHGRASVAVVVTTDDGQQVVGQTTWALLRTAFLGLQASAVVAEEVIDP